MNIYEKLIAVRKSVPFLKKDAEGYQFKYVSSSQTLGALREAMDANQLLLVPRILKYDIRDHTTKKGDHNYFTILDMEFTWVNSEKPDETVVCAWQGCGLDDGEKGTGKAVTYAEKYFLLKFFNIPTDKDDPDTHQKRENGKRGNEEEQNGSDVGGETPEKVRLREIESWIGEMSHGIVEDFNGLLKMVSKFTPKKKEGETKEPEEVWASNLDKLLKSPRWLNRVHSETKKKYAAWKELQENKATSNMPESNEDLPF